MRSLAWLCFSTLAAAWSPQRAAPTRGLPTRGLPTRGPRRCRPALAKAAVEVDLGPDGEPAGVCRLLFSPLLERSTLSTLDLRVPLGLRIEETGGRIVVQGALPGYSADGHVEPGDVLRAVTAYREVVAGAPMWQQVISYAPVGKLALKRLIFRTDGAAFADVFDSIASHRVDDGGNGVVTLVLERAVNSSVPVAPDEVPAGLEPLRDVILRDLKAKPEAGLDDQLKRRSAAERARGLFGVDDEEDDDGGGGGWAAARERGGLRSD